MKIPSETKNMSFSRAYQEQRVLFSSNDDESDDGDADDNSLDVDDNPPSSAPVSLAVEILLDQNKILRNENQQLKNEIENLNKQLLAKYRLFRKTCDIYSSRL